MAGKIEIKQFMSSQEKTLEAFRKFAWTGSFQDYINIVTESPEVTRNAFQRIYDMILSYGTEETVDFKKKIIHYNFFDDPIENGQDAVFGLEIPLMKLVNILNSAAKGYGAERRVILLHGP